MPWLSSRSLPDTLSLHRIVVAGIVVGCLASAACTKTGTFVWYSQLQAAEWSSPPGEYVIGVGDTINIRVFDQENLSLRSKIRSDGRVALPFVGEIVAAGKAPLVLARELEQRLKEFIVSPRVTVNVEESVPITVSVLGEVGARGSLSLVPPVTLVQVLAQSGGLNEFADDEAIYVLRKTPSFKRIRFTYDALMKNVGGASTFTLRSGDVVVVE